MKRLWLALQIWWAGHPPHNHQVHDSEDMRRAWAYQDGIRDGAEQNRARVEALTRAIELFCPNPTQAIAWADTYESFGD